MSVALPMPYSKSLVVWRLVVQLFFIFRMSYVLAKVCFRLRLIVVSLTLVLLINSESLFKLKHQVILLFFLLACLSD